MMLNIAVAFFIAVLSGLGVGGGGLFTVYLVSVGNFSQLYAQGINLLFFIFSAGASVLVGIRRKRIDPRVVAVMTLAGVLGVFMGAAVAAKIDQTWLRRIFGIMMMSGGITSLRASLAKSCYSEKYSNKRSTDIDKSQNETNESDSSERER